MLAEASRTWQAMALMSPKIWATFEAMAWATPLDLAYAEPAPAVGRNPGSQNAVNLLLLQSCSGCNAAKKVLPMLP